MAKLSLCMIAKDEADLIGRCLSSVTEIADEIIVVDTGSSDATAATAAGLGAQVYPYPWNDHFGAARNYSLELATGEWILILDADEALEAGSRPKLREILANDRPVEGYFLKLLNYIPVANWVETTPGMVFRLFRNKPEYRFQGSIHEQITDTIIASNPRAKLAIREDIQIHHYGYLKNGAPLKAKRQKYLTMLEKELTDTPENRLLRFQYGEELFHAGRYREALRELARAGDGLEPQVHFMPNLLRMIILSYLALQQFDAALKMVEKSIGLLPWYADLYHLGGVIHLEKRDLDQAVVHFEKALALPEPPSFYASVAGVRGYRTFLELGKIAELNADLTKALEYYTRSFQDNPKFTPALERIILLLNPYHDPGRVKTYLGQIGDFSAPDASLQVGALLYLHSAYQLALEYLELGGSSLAAPPDLEIWKADCLFQHGRFEAGFAKLANFMPDDPLYPMATFHQLIGAWLQQNQTKVNDCRAALTEANLSADTRAIIVLLQTTLRLLQAKNRTPPPENATVVQPDLGTEGITLFNNILWRALNIQAVDLAEQWVKGLKPRLISANAQNLGHIYQNCGYPEQAQYYRNLQLEAGS